MSDWFNDSCANRSVDNRPGTDDSVVIVEEAPRERRPEAWMASHG
jgi:hypothetical protein